MQLVVQLVGHEQDEADGRENGGNQVHDDVHGGQGARGLRGSAFRIAVGGEHGEQHRRGNGAAELQHEARAGGAQAVRADAGLPLAVFNGVADHAVEQRGAEAVEDAGAEQEHEHERGRSIFRGEEEQDDVQNEAQAIGEQQRAALAAAELDQPR